MTTESSLLHLDRLGIGSAEAVLISAFVAGVVALLVVRRHRTIAKKAKAYDVAEKFFGVERIGNEARLRELAKTGEWNLVIGDTNTVDIDLRRQIGLCLNEWELLCVAIRQNVVHEGVLKHVIGDRLVHIYMDAKELIDLIRKDNKDNEFFEHFEYIATKWDTSPGHFWRDIANRVRWRILKTRA